MNSSYRGTIFPGFDFPLIGLFLNVRGNLKGEKLQQQENKVKISLNFQAEDLMFQWYLVVWMTHSHLVESFDEGMAVE
jgi:hypothetical protein